MRLVELLAEEQKIAQDLLTRGGKDGFGVELHAVDGIAAMAQAHQFAFFGKSG